MRILWRVALPLVVGLLVLAAAVFVPVVHVRGSLATGPISPPHPAPPWTGHPVQVRWADEHRRVALHVRWGRACPPVLLGQTSTAPARIEVHVRLQQGAACRLHPRVTGFLLPPPAVAEPGQGVMVLVDGQRFDLPGYRR